MRKISSQDPRIPSAHCIRGPRNPRLRGAMRWKGPRVSVEGGNRQIEVFQSVARVPQNIGSGHVERGTRAHHKRINVAPRVVKGRGTNEAGLLTREKRAEERRWHRGYRGSSVENSNLRKQNKDLGSRYTPPVKKRPQKTPRGRDSNPLARAPLTPINSSVITLGSFLSQTTTTGFLNNGPSP